MENEPVLSMLMGLPASGKDTFIEASNLIKPGEKVIEVCPDKIRREHFNVQFDLCVEDEVWKIAYEMTDEYLGLGWEVIINATNITRARRKPFLDIAKKHDAYVCGVYFDVPEEVCLERNAKRQDGERVPEFVIKRMAQMLELPQKTEGFNFLMAVRGK